jgi:hypothetical protein
MPKPSSPPGPHPRPAAPGPGRRGARVAPGQARGGVLSASKGPPRAFLR